MMTLVLPHSLYNSTVQYLLPPTTIKTLRGLSHIIIPNYCSITKNELYNSLLKFKRVIHRTTKLTLEYNKQL